MNYNDTHSTIIEQCKNGDRKAQFELYRLYAKAMYNVCLRMVRDELDAEDILQSSFVDVFARLDSFRYQSSIGAWIKRIMINNSINFLRKKKLHFLELEDHHAAISEAETTEAQATRGLSVEAINQALFELPDGYRVVFSLYLLEGYDHQEIGQILGIAEATSKSQYSRAKARMKTILHQQNTTSA